MSSELRTLATDLARAEFTPPRYQPHVWAGADGNRDLARMSRVALIGIPELTARFETELTAFIDRIEVIDARPYEQVRREILELRVIDGGRA